MEAEQISLADRLFSGALSALFIGVMAILAPVFLLVVSRGRGLEVLGVLGTFHIWGTAVVIFAGLVGVACGSRVMVALLSHLWGTAQPQRPVVSVSLWATLFAIAFASYWLFGMHHAHV